MQTPLLGKNWIVLVAILASVATVLGCEASEAPQPTATQALTTILDQPYAGLEQREIRALDPLKVEDLLAGRGSGYALAAELNHYPGPTHVLEMRERLGLSKDQVATSSSIKDAMSAQAVRLGGEMVALEEELDFAFRSGTISSEELSARVTNIAGVEGQLRNAHLQAHLEMVKILTPEQVARYDELRGYTGDGSGSSPGDHDMHSMEHG